MRYNKKNELDVDIIGDQDKPLTDDEAKAISDYIKAKKLKANNLHSVSKKRVVKREKIA
jgi:hypothetical protein